MLKSPPTMKKILLLVTLLTCAVAEPGRAQFTGYYAFPDVLPSGPGFSRTITASGMHTSTANNWTIYSNNDGFHLQAPYVSVFPPYEQFTLFSGYLISGPTHFSMVEVTSVAPASGFLAFNFTLDLGTPSSSHAYYTINGAQFALTTATGSVANVALTAGDIFGFGVNIGPQSTVNQIDAHAILNVTNFSAPVPEPSTALLLLCGCGAAWLWSRGGLRLHKSI